MKVDMNKDEIKAIYGAIKSKIQSILGTYEEEEIKRNQSLYEYLGFLKELRKKFYKLR